MKLGKEKTIPIFAMIILIVGTTSAIYVHSTMIRKDTITIEGLEYTIDNLFEMAISKTIETDEGEKTGVALDDIIIKIGVNCPSCNEYIFIGEDRYQQTVSWELMQQGILSKDRTIYFPDTPHAFWVKNVVKIEVK